MKCCAGVGEITDLETLVNLARGSRYSLLWWPGPRVRDFCEPGPGETNHQISWSCGGKFCPETK